MSVPLLLHVTSFFGGCDSCHRIRAVVGSSHFWCKYQFVVLAAFLGLVCHHPEQLIRSHRCNLVAITEERVLKWRLGGVASSNVLDRAGLTLLGQPAGTTRLHRVVSWITATVHLRRRGISLWAALLLIFSNLLQPRSQIFTVLRRQLLLSSEIGSFVHLHRGIGLRPNGGCRRRGHRLTSGLGDSILLFDEVVREYVCARCLLVDVDEAS